MILGVIPNHVLPEIIPANCYGYNLTFSNGCMRKRMMQIILAKLHRC